MKVLFVVPDLYETRPRLCTNGWATTLISVTPDGRVLPCQGAQEFPAMAVPRIQQHSLQWIWQDSPLFNHFRGEDWLPEECRACPERHQDYGGCRCQAFQLTGDPANSDPVCDRSPNHQVVVRLRNTPPNPELIMRSPQQPVHNTNSLPVDDAG